MKFKFITLLLLISSTLQLFASAPDYSDLKYWIAHPEKEDMADVLPDQSLNDYQSDAEIDVFFIYPTIYDVEWEKFPKNADVNDEELNNRIAKSTIKNQASIFNGVGKVYSPLYRQANYQAYFVEQDSTVKETFDLAYEDVKESFQYFIKHWNKGRPFIIAAHSQGTTHGKRLIKELVDGKGLSNRLVVAYLVGMPVERDYFKKLKPCQNENQTSCFCSWRTYIKDYYPEYIYGDQIVATNPLDWTEGTDNWVDAEENKGSVLRKFSKVRKGLFAAQSHKGLLWVKSSKQWIKIALRKKDLHIADFNLFWMNVRLNAKHRVGLFWKM